MFYNTLLFPNNPAPFGTVANHHSPSDDNNVNTDVAGALITENFFS